MQNNIRVSGRPGAYFSSDQQEIVHFCRVMSITKHLLPLGYLVGRGGGKIVFFGPPLGMCFVASHFSSILQRGPGSEGVFGGLAKRGSFLSSCFFASRYFWGHFQVVSWLFCVVWPSPTYLFQVTVVWVLKLPQKQLKSAKNGVFCVFLYFLVSEVPRSCGLSYTKQASLLLSTN